MEAHGWDAHIAQVLVASMSSDSSIRTEAEHALTQGGTQPGFGLGLTRVALNHSLPYGTRQLAAVVLKKYVKEHWQEGEGRFIQPQTSDQEKPAIRELLPTGLSDPIPKIRTATGMAIATISSWDWPHSWPALTGILLGAIRERRSEDLVLGSLRCLAMIAGDMEESQVPEVVPFLFPELLSIVAADAAVYSLSLKRRALAVLHSCLLTLGMMSGAQQRAVRDLMAPLLPPWLDVFSAALATPPDGGDRGQRDNTSTHTQHGSNSSRRRRLNSPLFQPPHDNHQCLNRIKKNKKKTKTTITKTNQPRVYVLYTNRMPHPHPADIYVSIPVNKRLFTGIDVERMNINM